MNQPSFTHRTRDTSHNRNPNQRISSSSKPIRTPGTSRVHAPTHQGIAKVEDDFMQYAEEQRLDAGSTLAIVLIIGV